ncbi:microfibril-associated glycoprotein 4-like [Apostichopus japonicus]
MARFFILLVVAFFGCVYAQPTPPVECELPNNVLADIRETKAKIATLITKLRTYAITNGLPLPTEAAAVPEVTTIKTPTLAPEPVVFKTCKDILDAGYTTSGTYGIIVEPLEAPVPVFCDMTTDQGGWIVIQRRVDGSVDFNRTYAEYADGFGTLSGEFWLGNDLISALTKDTTMEMRIDMTDFDDVTVFAKYGKFLVDGANKYYRLNVGGEFQGDAGNSLSYHQRSPFSTFDSDNDASPSRNCALRHTGGWWFKNCMRSNLNGFYFPDGPHESYADGIEWSRFRGLKYSLKSTEMKIRPVAVTDNDI